MAAFCAQRLLLSSSLLHNAPSRRRSKPPTKASASASLSSPSSFQTPNPNPSNNKNKTLTLVTAAIASASASSAGFLFTLSSIGGGGGGSGGGRGGGGGGDGGFWSKIFAPLAANANEEEQTGQQEWDSHGLPANLVVQLAKLSGLKKYKISELLFFDRWRGTLGPGTSDSFFEMVSLRPGGVYTKANLQTELETLASCGMFEKVDLEAKTKPDGTIGLTVSFVEATWQSADAFRCINVGLMKQSRQMEMDADMTDREKMEYFRSQEREYKNRISKSRRCLLPDPVHKEIKAMLRDSGKVSARLLQTIRDRVQKWYHDEGYAPHLENE